jgi:hypothetical protein
VFYLPGAVLCIHARLLDLEHAGVNYAKGGEEQVIVDAQR